jgi:hypothetical protein
MHRCLIFAQKAQQQVLGFDLATPELAGFVARKKYAAACRFCISLKHYANYVIPAELGIR